MKTRTAAAYKNRVPPMIMYVVVRFDLSPGVDLYRPWYWYPTCTEEKHQRRVMF